MKTLNTIGAIWQHLRYNKHALPEHLQEYAEGYSFAFNRARIGMGATTNVKHGITAVRNYKNNHWNLINNDWDPRAMEGFTDAFSALKDMNE